MTPDEAAAYLESHIVRGVAPGLERMWLLMDLLGDPQRTCPLVHVTGTNGKTTVARATSAILRACGLKTGTYTSPHLTSVTERIEVDGAQITPQDLADAVAYLRPFCDEVEARLGTHPTYFEITTCLAFQHFADEACDAAVVEVGLGGVWDATNVAAAGVAVITNVSLDHTEYLGDDPVGIATEKAGIVKEGAVVVTGVQEPRLRAVIEDRCRDAGAEALWRLGAQVRIESATPGLGGLVLDVATPGGRYRDVLVPLLGAFQAANCALAIAAAEALVGFPGPDVVSEAFAVLTDPGRLEVVGQRPLTVVDGAHNPAGVAALLATLRETFHFERLHVVCGVLGDKDLAGIVGPLAAAADSFWATEPASARAASSDQVADVAESRGVAVVEEPDVVAAVDAAREAAGAHDLVLVTGSLVTVGEARGHLLSGIS